VSDAEGLVKRPNNGAIAEGFLYLFLRLIAVEQVQLEAIRTTITPNTNTVHDVGMLRSDSIPVSCQTYNRAAVSDTQCRTDSRRWQSQRKKPLIRLAALWFVSCSDVETLKG
jgi:hypothetical protein